MSEEQQRIRFDGVQMVAGALTAVTSAVLLSTVGVAGTLIGAAVGSVVGTVGNAVYSHYLALSKRRVAAAKVLAESKARAAGRDSRTQQTQQTQRVQQEREAREELAEADVPAEDARRGRVSWREAISGLPWRRILPVAAVVFVVALAAILVFELVSGRAVSSFTGGSDENTRTSIPGIGRTQDSDRPDRQRPGPDREPRDDQDPGTTPTSEPTSSPTPTPEVTPTSDPEPTDAPEPTAPEDPEVPDPTGEPTSAP